MVEPSEAFQLRRSTTAMKAPAVTMSPAAKLTTLVPRKTSTRLRATRPKSAPVLMPLTTSWMNVYTRSPYERAGKVISLRGRLPGDQCEDAVLHHREGQRLAGDVV